MPRLKFYALIRKPDELEGLGVKYDCQVVGLESASGMGGNTVEEAIESARASIKMRAEDEQVEEPDIQVVEFYVDI